jgi:hypothetical protein
MTTTLAKKDDGDFGDIEFSAVDAGEPAGKAEGGKAGAEPAEGGAPSSVTDNYCGLTSPNPDDR